LSVPLSCAAAPLAAASSRAIARLKAGVPIDSTSSGSRVESKKYAIRHEKFLNENFAPTFVFGNRPMTHWQWLLRPTPPVAIAWRGEPGLLNRVDSVAPGDCTSNGSKEFSSNAAEERAKSQV
jgi:hypothetical protein